MLSLGRKKRMKKQNKKRLVWRHICPICKNKFKTVAKFIDHIDKHKFVNVSGEPKNEHKQYLKAIFTGLTASALWNFIIWCRRNISAEDFQILFCLYL